MKLVRNLFEKGEILPTHNLYIFEETMITLKFSRTYKMEHKYNTRNKINNESHRKNCLVKLLIWEINREKYWGILHDLGISLGFARFYL